MTARLDDTATIDALMQAAIMLAQRTNAISAPQAANALGMAPDEYSQARREMVALGQEFMRRLTRAREDVA